MQRESGENYINEKPQINCAFRQISVERSQQRERERCKWNTKWSDKKCMQNVVKKWEVTA